MSSPSEARIAHAAVLILASTVATVAWATDPPCDDPFAPSCFGPHATPGCAPMDCCKQVCDFDPFCCFTHWDQVCVDEALFLCTPCPVCWTGAVPEAEPCGFNFNSGCEGVTGAPPFVFFETGLQCGTAVCGTLWADAGQFDTDWYWVNIPDPNGDGQASLDVSFGANGPARVEVFSGLCGSLSLHGGLADPGCSGIRNVFCVPTGVCLFKVSSDVQSGYPCGMPVPFEYSVSIDFCEDICDCDLDGVPDPQEPDQDGDGTPDDCDPCFHTCPPGATLEGEPCGSATNEGCNSPAPVFGSISCGETICGTAWADNNMRDTDWYELQLTAPCDLVFSVHAEFPVAIGLVDGTAGVPNCSLVSGSLVPFDLTSVDCGIASVTIPNLGPGTWWLFVGPSLFNGYSCGSGNNDYTITLTCGCSDCDGDGIPDSQEADPFCCQCICMHDSYCCGSFWDADCVQAAALACGQDCNFNGTLDTLDVLLGASLDCNMNCRPDECEAPCQWDPATSTCMAQCNATDPDCCTCVGLVDAWCCGNTWDVFCSFLADALCGQDCNGNGVFDTTDVLAGTSDDCNHNCIPDECEGFLCDDGDPCTDDACVAGACVHTPVNVDDGDPCTIDSCDPVTGLPVHVPVNVDDGNPCTIDSCDPVTGLPVHVPVNVDDGNPCTIDSCDPLTGQAVHTPVNVDDGDPCTVDSCDPVTGLPVHVPVNVDDGDPCTIDSCDPVTGLPVHVPVNVDDGDPCTIDSCDPVTGLPVHIPVNVDDGDPCTIDSCDPVTGLPVHVPVNVDDGDPCTIDSCDPATGLPVHVPVNVDDGDPCTIDSCDPVTGLPVHIPVNVDDGDPCTIDSCDPVTGLPVHIPVNVDDGDPCTIDSCDPVTGLPVHIPVNVDDGDPCTIDSCDPVTGLPVHVPVNVDDGDPCTIDSCDPATGLPVHTPEYCDDGDPCTIESCAQGCSAMVTTSTPLAHSFVIQGTAAGQTYGWRITTPCPSGPHDLVVLQNLAATSPSTGTAVNLANQLLTDIYDTAIASGCQVRIDASCPAGCDLLFTPDACYFPKNGNPATCFPLPQPTGPITSAKPVGTSTTVAYFTFRVALSSWDLWVRKASGCWCRVQACPPPAQCPNCDAACFTPCEFNPTIHQIPVADADCNGNGDDDVVDILTGVSVDLDADGVPDECSLPGCLRSNASCFTTHEGAGCATESCCATVCSLVPSCCTTVWDATCVDIAFKACAAPTVCDLADHTCVEQGGPGCSGLSCCSLVCGVDAACCEVAWDDLCVGQAIEACGKSAPCPDSTHPCDTAGEPGCTDEACCADVCIADPFCCQVAWDQICVFEAAELCAAAGDLNGDGVVDGGDLGLLLGNWGTAGPGDLDGNGVVDGGDLGLLLGLWTPEPQPVLGGLDGDTATSAADIVDTVDTADTADPSLRQATRSQGQTRPKRTLPN